MGHTIEGLTVVNPGHTQIAVFRLAIFKDHPIDQHLVFTTVRTFSTPFLLDGE